MNWQLNGKKRLPGVFIFLLGYMVLFASTSYGQSIRAKEYDLYSFGEMGQIKMVYDRRQRPQAIKINDKIHLVYNGNRNPNEPPRAATQPMITTFDLSIRKFTSPYILGPSSDDHHDGPVIWRDENDYIHVLYGCHKSPGVHLRSNRTSMGSSLADWQIAPQIAPSLSYPSIYQINDRSNLVYYRTAGHISSWTYAISNDRGTTWDHPIPEVTDLDGKGRFEWSSYQSVLPSEDGRFLHIVFTAYDDNRTNDPARYFNERYNKMISNEWKYNLYYLKIDLENNRVYNFYDQEMTLPVDLDQANSNCKIWDTEGRGAGVPPDILIDRSGNPSFLHVLSEESTERHNYYFVHRQSDNWTKTVIAPSNHQWNSCHLALDSEGVYHAYLIVGDIYLDTKWVEGKKKGAFPKGDINYSDEGSFMDKHGGGRLEEWTSMDGGETWDFIQDLTPDPEIYPEWKYNNMQPVVTPNGQPVEGMLVFYGWDKTTNPDARGFLIVKNAD